MIISENLDKGVGFHKCIEKYLLGETDFRADERAQVYLESVHGMLQEVEGAILVEERVNHPDMFYTGKLDCVATYRYDCTEEWINPFTFLLKATCIRNIEIVYRVKREKGK